VPYDKLHDYIAEGLVDSDWYWRFKPDAAGAEDEEGARGAKDEVMMQVSLRWLIKSLRPTVSLSVWWERWVGRWQSLLPQVPPPLLEALPLLQPVQALGALPLLLRKTSNTVHCTW
jgi:hypothetical protein